MAKSVKMQAEMLMSENGRKCVGIILKAETEEGKRLIDNLMSDKVSGLSYCKDKVIRPFAGGAGQYFIGFKREEKE